MVETVETAPMAAMAATPWPRLLEAALFAGVVVSVNRLQGTWPGLTSPLFEAALGTLRSRYLRQQRPYRVVKTPAGYCLRLVPPLLAQVGELLQGERSVKLPRPVVEVLAVVAYRQPVTAADVGKLTKSDPRAALRQLLKRELIALVPVMATSPASFSAAGEADTTAKEAHAENLAATQVPADEQDNPAWASENVAIEEAPPPAAAKTSRITKEALAYVTTARFLELFDLASLADLPALEDLQHLE